MRAASCLQKSVYCSTPFSGRGFWSFGPQMSPGTLRAPPEPNTIVFTPTSSARRHSVSAYLSGSSKDAFGPVRRKLPGRKPFTERIGSAAERIFSSRCFFHSSSDFVGMKAEAPFHSQKS